MLLPGRTVKTAANIVIAGNVVRDNNRPNFAPPGDLVAAVPAGTGILLAGVDATTARLNTVTGNSFLGIGVGSSLMLAALAGIPPEQLGDIEPNPDGVEVRHNLVRRNGTASPIPFLPPADLFWDGSGTGNCWERNRFDTSAPAALPACS